MQCVRLGLSIVNLVLAQIKVQGQIDKGGLESVNPIDAAQVSVGGVRVFASGMSMLGYCGSAMASVAGSANLVGMLLSMPGNWANVYQGAYELSAQPIMMGDATIDHIKAAMDKISKYKQKYSSVSIN